MALEYEAAHKQSILKHFYDVVIFFLLKSRGMRNIERRENVESSTKTNKQNEMKKKMLKTKMNVEI